VDLAEGASISEKCIFRAEVAMVRSGEIYVGVRGREGRGNEGEKS
jgi:hypothetical protein